jgi:hypothetical protein
MIEPFGTLTSFAAPRLLAPKPLTRRQRKERSTLVLEEPTKLLPPCLAAGTQILTEGGEVPVESLQPGDAVILNDGETGLVTSLAREALAPEAEAVRIRAGALGPGLPERDLLVSRDQGLFFDGVLAPASALIDGVAIRFEPVGQTRFYALRLEHHAALLAEGMPLESFFDRQAPTHGRPKPNIPFIQEGPVLGNLRARLHARKLMVGYTVILLPDITLHVGSRTLVVPVVDGAAHLALPDDATGAVLTTPTFIPAETDPASMDMLRRGIGVSDVLVNERLVPIESVFARADLYRPGPIDEFTWTRGTARLTLPEGALSLTLIVPAVPRAWKAPG